MPSTFTPTTDSSAFRRIAAAMWNRPSDPTIYGFIDIDASRTLPFIDRFREQTGKRLTITGVVAAAVARAFARHPELNAKVRFSGRLEQRSSVDLVVSVSTGGGRDLSAARVEDAGGLGLEALSGVLESAIAETRSGRDPDYRRSRDVMRKLPWWLVRPALRVSDFVGNELDMHLPKLGMPRDPFGTAVITNVGMFGIDTAFAPFVPLGRCPMLLLVTEVKERPVVVDGEIAARPVLRLCATFDHRIIDGYQAGLLARDIGDAVTDPSTLER